MTTATRSVAVVATRLPDIDRRALSQAWYSALHVTQGSAGECHRRAASASVGSASRPRNAGSAEERPPSPSPAAAAPRTRQTSLPAAMSERRGPTGELARRIERAIVRNGMLRPQQTAAIAVSVAGGRVQLLVRTDGTTTRIIALCAPNLRERVDRALAHARFALAATATQTRWEIAQ